MTSQQPVELILLRQLASYLTIAMWMMDASGNLLYYNEPAEGLLGVRFDEVGPLRADQLVELFEVRDLDGEVIPDSEFPVGVALARHAPAHRALRFCARDGVWRKVEVTAMPIEGLASHFLGVLATFWDVEK
ncbi:MAG TPA: PAS domain S-box protein [Acidimicrobiia bacterium]|nr:PAS domain S-box protein [Acidimicrobiia bacterium]